MVIRPSPLSLAVFMTLHMSLAITISTPLPAMPSSSWSQTERIAGAAAAGAGAGGKAGGRDAADGEVGGESGGGTPPGSTAEKSRQLCTDGSA